MKEVIKREEEVAKERKDTQAVLVVLKVQVHQLEVKQIIEQIVSRVEAEADQIVLAHPHLVID